MIARILLGSLIFVILTELGFSLDGYKRVEMGASYEALSPKSIYGSWKTGGFTFFHKPKPDFTYFIGGYSFSRKEGEAALLWGGAYKDWTDWLYTYSSFSFGTKSVYIPKYRLDHEFNFKIGERRNLVPSLGLSYIKYHDVHKDLVIGLGFTYYQEGWNFTYRHFINRSEPGNVVSSSDLLSLGIGREKHHWTYLDFSFGKQAYLATYLANPQEVRQNSLYVAIKHRHWITNDLGIFGDVSYFKLKGGYEKYGIGFGFFKEF